MSHLPLIVGIGGISPAGRSSFHHAYRRLVIDRLPAREAQQTLLSLAVMRGMLSYQESGWCDNQGESVEPTAWLRAHRESVLQGTLIRKLEHNLFDGHNLRQHQPALLSPPDGGDSFSFVLPIRHLPGRIPGNWTLSEGSGKNTVKVTVKGELDALFKDRYESPVNSAGQLPSGFLPAGLYPSRNHPRGLQMTVYGASDAIHSLGIDWEALCGRVSPEQISVYAGSSMSQLDGNGFGGMLQARLLGKKPTSKQLPLGFGEMPADFINAYLLGNLGSTGASMGACASFHYNLAQGIRDIQNGNARVAIVGGSEAPLVPEIIEGYANMGALADDSKLRLLDGRDADQEPDHRRACRPFGENVGFTLGESAQFVVLFEDSLALELGANILGAVNEVFVNADGHKKSIASPGVGNYLTVARAAAATRAVIGEEGLRRRSFVQAHGTGTPQNRVTESAIFRDVARHFGIESWPVTAIKAYLGHSLGCAGADQLACTLGVWRHGLIPGILTTHEVAGDVARDHLDFLLEHREVDPQGIDAVLLNAKGFGGNNATASLLSPFVAERMLARKHGRQAVDAWRRANEDVQSLAAAYDERCQRQEVAPIYKYDYDVREGADVSFEGGELKVRGYARGVSLDLKSRYADMQGD